MKVVFDCGYVESIFLCSSVRCGRLHAKWPEGRDVRWFGSGRYLLDRVVGTGTRPRYNGETVLGLFK